MALLMTFTFFIIAILTFTTILGHTRNYAVETKMNLQNETTMDEIIQDGILTKIHID